MNTNFLDKWFDACANNYLEVVQELLKDSRLDVNIKNNNGNTGFIYACANNYLEVVQELLKDSRLDVNIKNNNGNTGFIYACANNSLETVRELLTDSRLDVNIQNNYGNTGFIFACANNYLEVVQELLKDSRLDVNIKNNNGNTGYDLGSTENKRLIFEHEQQNAHSYFNNIAYALPKQSKNLTEILFCLAILQLKCEDISKVLSKYLEYRDNPEQILKQIGLDINNYKS